MNKVIISVVGVALVAGALVFGLTRNENTSQTSTSSAERSSTPSASTQTDSETQATTNGNGTYVDYDEAAFANATGKKVLFFHAPWCLQCRSVEAGITPGSIPDNVTIFKVDYDSRQDLRQKYDVRLQTSFVVIDEQGNVEKNYVAYDDPYFDSVKRALFES